MPTFRIVYIDDDTFTPRTLTAAFSDRAAAEIEMARHGHRIVHIVPMRSGETARDPIRVPMVPETEESALPERPAYRGAAQPLLGILAHDLAGVAVIAAGLAAAGVAIFFL